MSGTSNYYTANSAATGPANMHYSDWGKPDGSIPSVDTQGDLPEPPTKIIDPEVPRRGDPNATPLSLEHFRQPARATQANVQSNTVANNTQNSKTPSPSSSSWSSWGRWALTGGIALICLIVIIVLIKKWWTGRKDHKVTSSGGVKSPHPNANFGSSELMKDLDFL